MRFKTMNYSKGIALLVGLTRVNPDNYGGWNGENGCWGCELDVDNVARILKAQGFDVHIMKTEAATRSNILEKFSRIADTIDNHDIFVFYFSGHGGQQLDLDSDELDGHDETILAYDGEIIDDELYQRFRRFPTETRIVMISDSCNSGTNYKNLRDVPFQTASPIYPIPNGLADREEISFQMIHMGGCRDGGASHGYIGGGAFTTALCEAWADGAFAGSYKDLYEKVRRCIRSSQIPQYTEIGRVTEVFRTQKPFTVGLQVINEEDRRTVWRAIEIIDRMDILPVSLENELANAVGQVFPPTGDEFTVTAGLPRPTPWLDAEEALQVAQNEVDSMASGSDNDWPVGAKAVKGFPVYTPGQELPSYYECKIVDPRGHSAGYVLVNVDRSDLLVPEAAVEGLTITEQYRERLKSKKLQVVRFDWLRNVAVASGDADLSRGGVRSGILDAMGFSADAGERDPTTPQERLLTDYMDAYEEVRCFPFYDLESLDEYYTEMEEEIDTIKSRGTRARWRTISASLNGTFSSSRWHTPAWQQFDKPNGHAIGCGNTAWAIALAYFKQFHGKTDLFNGINVNTRIMSEEIKDCMRRCAVLCDTWDVADQGLTWPWKMTRGIGYAVEKGYATSSCSRERGSEYSKFDRVYNHLLANKPGILLIHHDGIGGADHYIVIEAGKKTQKKKYRRWRNRDVKYFCNFGWGGTRKWICVRDWGRNQNRVYSSFSVFLPNVI
jgi:hypothetical protein